MEDNKILRTQLKSIEKNFKLLMEKLYTAEDISTEEKEIFTAIEIAKNQFTSFHKPSNQMTWEESVKHMAVTKMDLEIPYKGYDHYLIVLKQFFRSSKKNINIFYDSLLKDVFKDRELLFLIEVYLSGGRNMNLIIQNFEDGIPSELLDLIYKYAQKNKDVKFRLAAEEDLNKVKEMFTNEKIYNFMVSEHSFILETEELKGVCNFNDNEIVKKLNKIFK